MVPVSKGEEYIIHIESVAARGAGVGRLNGFTIFVPRSIGGDTVRARITRVKKNYAEAELIEAIEPSADRIDPDCPHFPVCGGCALRHMRYGAQLDCKKNIVENAVRRIGGFADFELDGIIPAENTYGYRNKAVFRVGCDSGRVLFGFNSAKTHHVVAVDGCLICGGGFTEIASAVSDYANKHGLSAFDGRRGILKSVFVRSSRETGEIAVVISANAQSLPHEDNLVKMILSASGKTSGIMLEYGGRTRAVYGKKTLTERICGINFNVSAESFLQVNPEQTERLYAKALEFADIGANDTVMDLYCGIGTITLAAAKQAGRVIGVETIERAIRDAEENARRNGITNAEFFAADTEEIVPRLIDGGTRPNIVILDPPRAGSDEKTLAAICAAAPKRIVYVSCDSASLARDLRFINANGYDITRAAAVDMFPHTAHVETVVLLSRIKD